MGGICSSAASAPPDAPEPQLQTDDTLPTKDAIVPPPFTSKPQQHAPPPSKNNSLEEPPASRITSQSPRLPPTTQPGPVGDAQNVPAESTESSSPPSPNRDAPDSPRSSGSVDGVPDHPVAKPEDSPPPAKEEPTNQVAAEEAAGEDDSPTNVGGDEGTTPTAVDAEPEAESQENEVIGVVKDQDDHGEPGLVQAEDDGAGDSSAEAPEQPAAADDVVGELPSKPPVETQPPPKPPKRDSFDILAEMLAKLSSSTNEIKQMSQEIVAVVRGPEKPSSNEDKGASKVDMSFQLDPGSPLPNMAPAMVAQAPASAEAVRLEGAPGNSDGAPTVAKAASASGVTAVNGGDGGVAEAAIATLELEDVLEACTTGDGATVRAFAEAGGDLNAALRDDGSAAIVVAAEANQAALVSLIADLGGDVDKRKKDGSSAVMRAAASGFGSVVEALGRAGADLDRPRQKGGMTPLSIASSAGHTAVVQALLNAGISANQPVRKGGRPVLTEASQRGHHGVVEALLRAGAKVNAHDVRSGETALFNASAEGYTEIVRLLIGSGADVQKPRRGDRRVPLQAAEEGGHFDVVMLLLEAGAVTPSKGKRGKKGRGKAARTSAVRKPQSVASQRASSRTTGRGGNGSGPAATGSAASRDTLGSGRREVTSARAGGWASDDDTPVDALVDPEMRLGQLVDKGFADPSLPGMLDIGTLGRRKSLAMLEGVGGDELWGEDDDDISAPIELGGDNVVGLVRGPGILVKHQSFSVAQQQRRVLGS